jgi:hypothetical protein
LPPFREEDGVISCQILSKIVLQKGVETNRKDKSLSPPEDIQDVTGVLRTAPCDAEGRFGGGGGF